MVKKKIDAGQSFNPDIFDLRYVKRFLMETANHTNDRVGVRLALLLTELHADDHSLFDPQATADSISASFQKALTVAGAPGVV